MRRWAILLVVTALLAAASAAAAQPGTGRASPAVGSDFQISAGPGTEDHAAAAWNSTNQEYLVVWDDDRVWQTRGTDIWGQRFSAGGAAIAPAFRISAPAAVASEYMPAVAWNAERNEYLVVWDDNRDMWHSIYGQRVSAAGTRIGGDHWISYWAPRDARSPDVAWNPVNGQFLVVWSDNRAGTGAPYDDIYGQRVRDGGRLAGGEFRISGPDATGYDGSPAVVWNGTREQYLVVWSDHRDAGSAGHIFGRRLGASGRLLGDDFQISGEEGSPGENWPGVAWNAVEDQYLVAWQDDRPEGSMRDVYGRRVRGNGVVMGATDVHLGGVGVISQWLDVAVAWSASADQYLVVWEDGRNAGTREIDIYGRKVKANGLPAGPDFRVSGDGATGRDIHPVVVWSPANDRFLVVWRDGRNDDLDLYGRLVTG